MSQSYLFLVSSAINHFKENEFSRFSGHDRFLQTIETINSIRKKVENVYICLFELSNTPLKKEYVDELKSKIDLYLDFHDDKDIQQLYGNFNVHPELFKYGKSLLELRGLGYCLDFIYKNDYFEDTVRVFKITGRYLLNDNFNIQDYNSKFLSDKYIIKHYNYNEYDSQDSVHYNVYQNKGSVVTALWSFDYSLLTKTMSIIEKSFFYLQKMLLYTPGNDIEHAIYNFIDKSKIINCEELGVTVRKGMDFDDYNE